MSIMVLGAFTGCGATGGNANATSNLPEALSGDHDESGTLEGLEVTQYSSLFLLRNKQAYHLGAIQPGEENYYGIIQNPKSKFAMLCFETQSYDSNKENLISVENAPVPIIHQNDKIYGDDPNINVKSLKFTGYTPLIVRKGASLAVGANLDSILIDRGEDSTNMLNRIIVSTTKDFSNKLNASERTSLKYGEEVFVRWKNKQESGVLETKATCAHYEYAGEAIKLESIGEETLKDGKYNIYDPTKLDKGYWALCIGNKPYSVILVQ